MSIGRSVVGFTDVLWLRNYVYYYNYYRLCRGWRVRLGLGNASIRRLKAFRSEQTGVNKLPADGML